MSEFSDRFRQLKDQSELSSKELAQKLGIAPSTLSYYLKDREPNYNMLIKIADYFDVTIDWLVGNERDYTSIETERFELIEENKILKSENKRLKDKLNKLREFINE